MRVLLAQFLSREVIRLFAHDYFDHLHIRLVYPRCPVSADSNMRDRVNCCHAKKLPIDSRLFKRETSVSLPVLWPKQRGSPFISAQKSASRQHALKTFLLPPP